MRTALLPLLFLVFFLATKPLLGTAHPDPVLDTSGEELLGGVNYQILPISGGGLALSPYENDTCPLLVVQENIDILKFPPVTFSPAHPREDNVIHTSMNLNIKFSDTLTTCANSMVWRLLKRITEARFVSTDGVEGHPGVNTLVNWFKIEMADSGGYKLRFCPTEICHCKVVCSDLGIFIGEDSKRYLGLADQVEPLGAVVFRKAESAIVMSRTSFY